MGILAKLVFVSLGSGAAEEYRLLPMARTAITSGEMHFAVLNFSYFFLLKDGYPTFL